MMGKVPQAGLVVGISAEDGIHTAKPKPVAPSFGGLDPLLPDSLCPR